MFNRHPKNHFRINRLAAPIVLGLALLTSACGHLAEAYSPVATVPDGTSVVYIYRSSEWSGSDGAFMVIASTAEELKRDQGKNVGFIESGGFTPYFAHGPVRFTMPYGSSSVDVDVKAGQTYYVRLEYLGGDERAKLALVPESEAKGQIADTNRQTNTFTGR